ncbi:aldehyde dehydrogenase [Halorubrum sp. CBA1125]|uniref:aldehyde dehydrogenase n=1 Tax=Halorubrum sp. CBA1125 TaxID=2668072 RepID=UPI0012E81BC4|nr:aldehyde dehydrogenase [Halorubrum sp. CBA1125]MUW15248.1 aldehyde dehydrogenase [Halorubrum sp. CBA1125]
MTLPDTDKPLYIDGEWRESQSSETVDVVNPATEDVVDTVQRATADELDAALDAAEDARVEWAETPARERGEYLREMAEALRGYQEEIGEIIIDEAGKIKESAYAEAGRGPQRIEYNAEWDRRMEGDIVPSDDRDEKIDLQRHPYGVVVGITPWNSPVSVFARKLAPALVAGNTVVMKPSTDTPLSAMRVIEIIDEHVDLPDGVLNFVVGSGSHLVEADQTDMITMTGSTQTGKAIMRSASDQLKEVSLELGGKAPAIVWKDADLDAAVEDILVARVSNTGQVCTCAERVYVHSDVAEEFTEKYVDAMESITVGDPRDESVDMGPQVNRNELEGTEGAVQNAVEQGARVLTGGKRPETLEKGFFYEPTVLTDVTQDMDIIQDEVFGPVSPIIEIDSFDEAVEYANDSRYGLSSYVFTRDYEIAMEAAQRIEFGEVFINRTLGEALQGHHIGWNESGMGGEDGKYGVLKYTQLKTVYHNW